MSVGEAVPSYDVAIVGAGPAGCAAALAASARGARCLLVDRGPKLGGNIGNAFVHTICGLYLPVEAVDAADTANPGSAPGPHAEPVYASPGLASRLAREFARRDAAGEVERAGKVFVLPTDPRRVAAVLADLLRGAPGLDVRLGSELVAVGPAGEGGGHLLELVGGAGDGGPQALAQVLIDTSGDADAAALAGADFELEAAARLQNPSYIVCLRGIEAGAIHGFARMQTAVAVAGAARKGALPRGCESLVFRPGRDREEAFVTVNLRKPASANSATATSSASSPVLPKGAYDPLDRAQRESLAAAAREDVASLLDFLRAERPGFEKVELAEFAERIGVREGRRVRGRERVEAEHVIKGRTHRDEVARACWPIELWHGHERASFEHVAGACSVPLGALVSRSHPRIGTAGRCLSASHEALGSLRVIGTALATGEAIGAAAAFAAEEGSSLHEVDAGRIRESIAASAAEPLLS